jgi:MinD-like ATPase involved in chromosome partitioning or flagellar assembly
MHYGADTAIALLRTLRQLGRPIIIDLGCGYSTQFSNLQPELDQLVVVIDSNPTTLSMARELIREIETGHDSGRLHVTAINRTTTPGQIWQDVERYIGHAIRGVLSPGVDLILQSQQASVPPVMFQPAAMYSTQVVKLAEEIMVRQSQGVHQELS